MVFVIRRANSGEIGCPPGSVAGVAAGAEAGAEGFEKAGGQVPPSRDDPRRVRAFGYNPVAINVLVFTISAGLAGLAGALFAPIVGIVSPTMIGVVPSIEMVIWVAVGGRGTLIGPIIGALLVNGAKSSLSESFPLFWQYFLGALFVGSVLFFPRGIYGLFRWAGDRWFPAHRVADEPRPALQSPFPVGEG